MSNIVYTTIDEMRDITKKMNHLFAISSDSSDMITVKRAKITSTKTKTDGTFIFKTKTDGTLILTFP